jgi:two-component system cell cycle response regulator
MEARSLRQSAEGRRPSSPSASPILRNVRGAWIRIVRFEREWLTTGPTMFALLAAGLLVYNHTAEQVNDVAFWIGLALVGSVFVWLIQNNHQESRHDAVTGLGNRLQLREDLTDAGESSGDPLTLLLIELDGLIAYQDRFGFEAGDELMRGFARDLAGTVERLDGTAYRIDGGQFSALIPTNGRQPGEIVLAVTSGADLGDEENPVYRPHGEVSLRGEVSDPDVALKLAGERLVANKQRQRRSAKRQAQDALVAVLGTRRPELQQHIRAVAFRAISIGRLLGLDQAQLDDVVSAAKLQNIGLLAIPDQVLDKETELTAEEREMIRGHSSAGAHMISAAPTLASVAALVRSSCENYDGSGYPDGLAGDAIPLGSRIVAVCVAYTALTAIRPHRPAHTPAEALEILRDGAGTQFDPRIVEALAEDLADEISQPDSEAAAIRL